MAIKFLYSTSKLNLVKSNNVSNPLTIHFCLDQRINFEFYGEPRCYIGGIDAQGQKCGFGRIAIRRDNYTVFRGTWLGGEKHGLCKWIQVLNENFRAGIESDANNGIYKVFEYKRGNKFGRSTRYDGSFIQNQLIDDLLVANS